MFVLVVKRLKREECQKLEEEEELHSHHTVVCVLCFWRPAHNNEQIENARFFLPKNCFSEKNGCILTQTINCRNSFFCFFFCNIDCNCRTRLHVLYLYKNALVFFSGLDFHFFLSVVEVESYHRNIGGKRPPGRYDFASVTRRPGALTSIPGRFLKKDFGAFGPPGRYVCKNKKKSTHLSHAGRHKKPRKKPTPLIHTHTATARQQQVLIMSQPSSTDKAPHKEPGDWTWYNIGAIFFVFTICFNTDLTVASPV